MLHIRAQDDDRVLFNGGSGSASNTHADFVSVPDTIAKWVKLNACHTPAQRVLEVPGAYCEVHAGCQAVSTCSCVSPNPAATPGPAAPSHAAASPARPRYRPMR